MLACAYDADLSIYFSIHVFDAPFSLCSPILFILRLDLIILLLFFPLLFLVSDIYLSEQFYVSCVCVCLCGE